MLRVIRIGDNLEEVRVTKRAADILGWAGSGAADTGRGAWRGIGGDQALESRAVLPVIAEVVDIDEALMWLAAEVAEPNHGLVESASVIFELVIADLVWIAVAQPTDDELVEMAIPPAEGGLDYTVQVAQIEAPRHHDLAPDRWPYVDQGDVELHSGRFFPGHAAIMTGSAGPRQSIAPAGDLQIAALARLRLPVQKRGDRQEMLEPAGQDRRAPARSPL